MQAKELKLGKLYKVTDLDFFHAISLYNDEINTETFRSQSYQSYQSINRLSKNSLFLFLGITDYGEGKCLKILYKEELCYFGIHDSYSFNFEEMK